MVWYGLLPQGFIKAIVGPLYKTFSKVDGVDMSECIEHLRVNARTWKEQAVDEDAAARKAVG